MDLGIRPKLIAAFAVVAMCTGVLGWYAVSALERVGREQRTLVGDVFGGTHLLATWIDNAWEARSDLLPYLVVEDPVQRARLRARMLEIDASLDDLARQMDVADIDREDVETLTALSSAWRSYAHWRERAVIAPFQEGDRAAALSAYQREGDDQNAAIDAAIDAFLTRKREVGTDLEAAGESTYMQTRNVAAALTAAAAALALLIGLIVSRSVAAHARLAEERETRVRAVMDSVADGILTLDNNGLVESINPAGEQIFGYTAAEIVGQDIDRLLPDALQAGSANGQAANTELEEPKLTIGERREVRGYDSLGSPLSVELTLSEAPLKGRCLHIAVVRDITHRKRADQRRGVQYAVSWALAGSRTLEVAISGVLHAIAEGFDWQLGVFWSVDGSADVLRCHAIWRARDVTAEEFISVCRRTSLQRGVGLPGRAWQNRQPVSLADVPEDVGRGPQLDAAAEAGLHGGFAFPIEGGSEVLGVIELFSTDPRPADLDLIMTVTAIGQQIAQFIERDRAEQQIRALNAGLEERVRERTAQLEEALTERRWAAEKIEELRRRNELILTSAGEGIYGVDCNGRATFVNPAAAALTGYEVSQLLERPLHEALRHSAPDGTNYAPADCPLCAVLRDGSIRTGDAEFGRQDGSTFPVSYTSTPIWEYEAIVGAVVTFQDVTERRAMDKLKDEFVSMVSHEIRTPMNGVLGMVELLLDTPLNARQREYADAARRSGETLLAIVNDILDSAKIEAGKLELELGDLDVRAVAEDVVGLFAAQGQAKGLEIACLVHRDVPRGLLGDAARLRQVLMNLVGNAVKFTEQGEVMLRARVATRARDAIFVRFEVTDTGPGIAPDAAQRIFQPFSQADPSTTRKYGGTGLGLTISKQLVELMGGQIGVETKLGEGSTFWFIARLPRQRFPAGAPPPAELRELHVLAVDDNAATRAVLDEHLTAWGVALRSVDAAPAALEALRAAADDGKPFDVLIFDRHLAGIEGLELARRVRMDPRLASTKLVLLSPLIEDPLPPDAEAIGIAAWLTKPVRQSQLFDTLVSVATGAVDATARAAATPAQTRSSTDAAEPGGPRVLVVEDTPINQQVARGMLARLGFSAELASNGLEALEALNRGSYAAILMDCHMPGMDGFESSREIRRREGSSRHTPIIAMTASAMRGERERCLAAGMDDYIAKPVRLQELRRRLLRWSASGPSERAFGSDAGEAGDGQAAASKEAADFDPRVLLSLRSFSIAGEADPVVQLVDLFTRDAPARLGRIRAAVQQNDAQGVHEAAHALKGSAGTLGARRMHDLCAELEDRAASGALDGAGAILDALEAAYEGTRRELDALRTADDRQQR
jgi:PAS domain S-box-containing protein